MGLVQGHPATEFIFAALLYWHLSFINETFLQRAYQMSGPYTVGVTQRFLLQRVRTDQPQLTEKKTNSEAK